MAIIKCKMCGGDLEILSGVTVAECEYCGTKQTLPKGSDEVVQNLFNRANNLRIKCEFDKAEQIYEKILQEDDTEAEAHWGIVLCKYGIEYVEDPKTYKRIPTCHRTSYDAVTADAEYLAAIEHADIDQKTIYEAEAKAIDQIQKNILSIVKNETPFDVFICYKETDENGKRTIDSAIANDIYHQLTLEGLKVFYAAITLEDKLGQEYEPYIFAALHSAKTMLVIGTKPQYFSAVWVKNEWSRFLKLMKTDRSKLLIPCYKDMDAYDLPEEFAHLQSQDMGKIGFINDVVRGIKKVTVKEEPKPTAVKETVVTTENTANITPLLERTFLFLEDGKWTTADEYCEKVLDLDPKCAEAYLGKLMAQLQVKKQNQLQDLPQPFDQNEHYPKAVRFGDEAFKKMLSGYNAAIVERNKQKYFSENYEKACEMFSHAKTQYQYEAAANRFNEIKEYKDSAQLLERCRQCADIAQKDSTLARAKEKMHSSVENYECARDLLLTISGWKNADELIEECRKQIREIPIKKEEARKDRVFDMAKDLMQSNKIPDVEHAMHQFRSIAGWKTADALAEACRKNIEQLKQKEEAVRQEIERRKREEQEEVKRRAKKRKITKLIIVAAICLAIATAIAIPKLIIPTVKYNKAMKLVDTDRAEAIEAAQEEA